MATAEQTQDQDTQQDTEEVTVPEGQILHTLSDDDDDGEEGGEQQDPTLDKRGKRSWAREAKQKLADYETKFSEMSEKLARLEGRQNAPQQHYQPPQQQQTVDPIDQQIAAYEERMDSLMRISNKLDLKTTTEKEINDLNREYREAQKAVNYLVAQKAVQAGGQPQQQGPSVQIQMLMSEAPQIYQDEALNWEARAEALRLARQDGLKQPNFEHARKANQRVLQRHGIGQKAPPPTNADKAKLAGTSGKAGASGQGGNQIALSQRDVSDALAYFNGATGKYSTWTEKQRVDYWVKNVKLKGKA